ncbi:MAG TPA: 50S ribosomal protein L11 methyltransferase [Rhodanobacteraceae bacterium]|nr:50S ribosomal protein L11 methyltransferase [Rhodanobacteraceae bacterium]
MPYLEVSLTLTAEQQPRAEATLEELGALSITLLDADAQTPDERAIFEPGVGETPLWKALVLNALFESDVDRGAIVSALRDSLPELSPGQVAFREVADQDWERAWMDRFQPMRFGRRLWIYPWNIEPPADEAERVIVRLDPGLAFGTGTHPTTALCLEWLDSLPLAGKTVLDFGCGSGVLAIAALKLGAAHAIGVDNDPQALTASQDNAQRNGVAGRLALCAPGDLPVAQHDVLVANILAGPLHDLAPLFATLLKPGAPFALSGILAGQEGELLGRYAACGFADLQVAQREDWMRIAGVRSKEQRAK